jgi:hypothetical protein
MNYRRKLRTSMSRKSRRKRIAKLKKASAYPVGAEVGHIEINIDCGYTIVVSRCAVSSNGRRLVWEWYRNIGIERPDMNGPGWREIVQANGVQPLRVKRGDPVPTRVGEAMELLKGLG